jgi:hypothetical protein
VIWASKRNKEWEWG